MNHSLHRTLYTSAAAKYLKLKRRYERRVQNNTFHQLTKRKQFALINQLKKLYERLKSLHKLLRLAATGSVVALTLAATDSKAQGLGPFVRSDPANPLPPPHFIVHPRVAMVDIDNDGDLDSFVGNVQGYIQFFRNDSPEGTVRRLTAVFGPENPFNGINKGPHAAPAFADVDGDGDLDMLWGVNNPFYDPPGGPSRFRYSPTFFFRNTGSATNPVFTEQTGSSNPFDGIYGAKYGASIPTFVKMDGDGDVDLFMGGSFSSDIYGPNPGVQYFQNQGTVTAPNFVATSHPLATTIQYQKDASISFADFDTDGDLDALVGQRYSGYGIRAFRNDGASFTELIGEDNPANGISLGLGSPVIADVDGDEDLDLIVGHEDYGSVIPIRYFENTGSFNLEERSGLNINPFGGVDVGEDAAPAFVDLDNDGDLDAVIGSKYGSVGLSVFRNDDGVFIAFPEHPLTELIEFKNVTPVFVDIDNDGDSDLFYGGRSVTFYKNTGTAANPVFTLQANAFPSLNSGNSNDLSISFIDLNGDDKKDAIIGNDRYEELAILYFENTGTVSSPVFTQEDLPEPFDDATLFERNPNVVAVDLDNDGDLDLAITETYYNGWYGDSDAGRTRFFENLGNGDFEEMSNPLIIELTPLSITAFADIDGDGDLDAFVGSGYSFDFEQDGKVFYYENTNPPPVTEVSEETIQATGFQPIQLDPDLTIDDPDSDDIVLALVTIDNYSEGDGELDFEPVNGISGTYDDETGILTFRGKASVSDYEEVLQSVTLTYTGDVPAAKRAAKELDLLTTVTFQVRDVDFTLTTVSVITVNVIPGEPINGITVYNAISPGATQDLNDYIRIEGLPSDNQVTIYNRWGDQVFKISGYNNISRRFEGKNDNGNELPSGTYFYKIEASGKTITGYLSLKR